MHYNAISQQRAPEGRQSADLVQAGNVLQCALHVGHQEGLGSVLVQHRLEGQRVEAVGAQVAVQRRVQLRIACKSINKYINQT